MLAPTSPRGPRRPRDVCRPPASPGAGIATVATPPFRQPATRQGGVMRNNGPVSQREYPFRGGETLVSTTDLQGRIIYCNSAFVTVSGYQREELLGQPHNMIRHPDMPPEAFRDMWATIQSGQPWSAMVKNRRKDGDHYWVQANVTPLLDERGKPNGFMSVRTEPERADVQAAEALYARMRQQGESGVLGLKQGHLVDASIAGRIAGALRLSLGARMNMTVLLMGLIGMGLGFGLSSGPIAWGQVLLAAVIVAVLSALGAWYLRGAALAPIESLVRFANRIAA